MLSQLGPARCIVRSESTREWASLLAAFGFGRGRRNHRFSRLPFVCCCFTLTVPYHSLPTSLHTEMEKRRTIESTPLDRARGYLSPVNTGRLGVPWLRTPPARRPLPGRTSTAFPRGACPEHLKPQGSWHGGRRTCVASRLPSAGSKERKIGLQYYVRELRQGEGPGRNLAQEKRLRYRVGNINPCQGGQGPPCVFPVPPW